MKKTRRKHVGGGPSKTMKARGNAITDADVEVALKMEPIPYELFFDDQDKYTGYRMKMVKDDVYELSNYGKYYPKKGGVRTETADVPMMFVYDGYLYKKTEKQTKTGNLKYDRQVLPVEDFKKEDLDEFADAGDRGIMEEIKEPIMEKEVVEEPVVKPSYTKSEKASHNIPVITKELFDDSYENPNKVDGDYTGYRMKLVKDNLYELTNSGKYYPKKGGVRTETADVLMMFVYDGYLYKKNEKQTKTGNLRYTREKLPSEEGVDEGIEEEVEKGLEERVEEKGLDERVEEKGIDERVEEKGIDEVADERVEEKGIGKVIDERVEEPARTTNEIDEYEYKKEHPNNTISITINGETITQDDDFLYPSLNDPYLNVKIANRKEFSSYMYDGTPDNVKTRSDYVCREDREFELLPHQLFVKNFLSKNTPYRSILLYHGLGSGKTCSAIGICETMRASMKQTGVVNKILIIASTNVQDNFRLQLFDDQKLKRSSGAWTMDSCVGNSLLREINPTNDVNITAEKIASQANSIINTSYAFMGYLQFANYVQRRALTPADAATYTEKQKNDIKINNIKRLFNNRLIVIDEVHNVPNSMAAPLLMLIAEHAENVRFVLLSATPMYNSVEEIIWITNLMNINDKRQPIRASDVFDKKGIMFPDSDGPANRGEQLLRRKLNGYVSYVRGENPYTFPFRLYPDIFSVDNTFLNKPYPTKTITGNDNLPTMHGMKNRIFITDIGSEQERAYNFIVNGANIFTKKSGANIFRTVEEDDDNAIFENMESFGYTKLQIPLQSLIMTFPSPTLNKLNGNYDDVDPDTAKEIIGELVGKNGINKAMSFKEERKQIDEETYIYMKHKYEYKKGYEGLFTLDKLRAHSSKIAHICTMITEQRSTGIIMVYTQYIDGGVVPMALALEELGFARYGSNQQFVKPLFKKGAAINQEPRDAKTMELRPEYAKTRDLDNFKQAKYMILSGDKYFSQNNAKDIKYATSKANRDGEEVRVILISRAASEGLDFKFIRQVHVLDPWYNLNRTEQIVGRGVRNMSHCGLPFEERNVEIYLHATVLNDGSGRECADHYVYRYAENKAIIIGKVTRLLKEVSVDCKLNLGQSKFTYDILKQIPENEAIPIHPSSAPAGALITIQVGDKTGTEACDYAENCNYTCSIKNESAVEPKVEPVAETYDVEQMRADSDRLIDALKSIYKSKSSKKMSYHIDEIKKLMEPYMKNEDQLMLALTQIVDNPYEKIFDKYGREGRMINRDQFYAFQPLEITDKRASLLENSMPVHFKHDKLNYEISNEVAGSPMLPTSPGSPMPGSPLMEDGLFEMAIENLRKNMAIVENPVPYEVMASEEDWAINLNSISKTPRLAGAEKEKRRPLINFFLIEEHGFTREQILKYAFEHFMDTMNHRFKKSLIENLDKMNNVDPLQSSIKRYFEMRKFSNNQSVGYIFTKVSKNMVKNSVLYRETPETSWTEEEPGEVLDFKYDMQERLTKDLSKLNATFGFVGYFTGRGIKEKGSAEGSMEYMTKTLGRGRGNKGAKLSGKGKDVIITLYNSMMDTVGQPQKHYVEKDIKDISKNGFAVVLEMLLRKFQDEGKGPMGPKVPLIWHLTPEEAIANGINEYDI